MALLHLQYSYQAETLSQMRPRNSPVWFRTLVLIGEGLSKLSTVHTKSLLRILFTFWLNFISNKHLLKRCGTEPMATNLIARRWRWISHVTRQSASTSLHWMPEGKRKRGHPKITWQRTVGKEIKEMGKTWGGIKLMARDRQMWREHVAALHAT